MCRTPLKSYSSDAAVNAVVAFKISEPNYDSALKILEVSLRQKEVIINHHMNKFLNLEANEIRKLKKIP